MKPKHENWAPIQMLCHMPNVHLKPNQGQRNNASRKYLSLYLFVHYKFRSSTVTDKQSVCLNITSVHLSVFIDFANIFIRTKHIRTIIDSLWNDFHYGFFFHTEKLFLQNENLNEFRRCFLEIYNLHLF